MAVSITLTDTPPSDSPGGATSSTFTGVAIGTAAPTRVVFVDVNLYDPVTVTSVTIGGVAASLADSISTAPSGNSVRLYVFWANVASGTTATIVVNYSGSTAFGALCGIVVYDVEGADSVSPISATSTAAGAPGITTASASIAVPTNGALLGGANDLAFGTVTWTWTNATKDSNVSDPRLGEWSTASSVSSGTYTVTAANDGSGGFGQVGLVLVAIAVIAGSVTQVRVTITQGQSVHLTELRAKTIALVSAQTVRLTRAVSKSLTVLAGQVLGMTRAIQKMVVVTQAAMLDPHAGRTNNRTFAFTQAQTVALIARFAKLKTMAVTQAQTVALVRSVTRQTQKMIAFTQAQVVHLTTLKVLALQAVELLHNVIQRVRTLSNKPLTRIRSLHNTNSRRKP